MANSTDPQTPERLPEGPLDPLDALGAAIVARNKGAVTSYDVAKGELTVHVDARSIADAVAFLRADPDCQFTFLVDLTAVDWPSRAKRFDMVYHLLSMCRNQRLRVKAQVSEEEVIPSITSIFPGANWLERDVFDMFGIVFMGHPDMQRMLTDQGTWEHPLRKDVEPDRLTQEWPQFGFTSPWEGGAFALPGDDKASPLDPLKGTARTPITKH